MAQPMEPTTIRASSLSQWPDCPRRSAARMFKAEIERAGFKLSETPRGVGLVVGISLHSSAELILGEKARSGALPPLSVAQDAAAETLKEETSKGVMYDKRATQNRADAESQVIRMARSYHADLAPKIFPIIVEERLEAQVSPYIVLSGQPDSVAREPGTVVDLKSGTILGNHAPQLGAYSLLARTPTPGRPEGIEITSARIDWVPRSSMKRPQPDPVSEVRDIGAAETAASRILQEIERSIRTFREGDEERRILPGDAWAFTANPSSKLCGPAYCPAFGGDFCREHAPAKDAEE